MVELKTEAEIDAMAAAGAVVAEALRAVVEHAPPGQPTAELDKVAADVLARARRRLAVPQLPPALGAEPVPGGAVRLRQRRRRARHPQRRSARRRRPRLGRLRRHAARLVRRRGAQLHRGNAARPGRRTDRGDGWALAAGIAAVRPGNTLGDVGHAIAAVARGAGYGLLADHGGHGIGRTMHEDPHVPNEGRPGKGMRLRPGLVIAIEPMLIADGTDDYTHDPDGLDAAHRVGCPRRAQRAHRRGHRRPEKSRDRRSARRPTRLDAAWPN